MWTASVGMLGAIAALSLDSVQSLEARTSWILPFSAGGFLNIGEWYPELLIVITTSSYSPCLCPPRADERDRPQGGHEAAGLHLPWHLHHGRPLLLVIPKDCSYHGYSHLINVRKLLFYRLHSKVSNILLPNSNLSKVFYKKPTG